MIPHRPVHIHPDTSIIFLTGRLYGGFSWLYPNETKQYFMDKLTEILPAYHLELDAHVVCHNHYHLLLRVGRGELLSKFVKHLHGATSHFIKQHIPEVVSLGGQVLTQHVTSWDKRQSARLDNETSMLERELKFATTEEQKLNVLAKFTSRHSTIERRLKSATTDNNVLAKFISHPDILVLLAAEDPPIWYQYMDHVIRDEADYYKHFNYIHQNPVKHGMVKRMTEYPWSSIHTWVEEKGKDFVIDCFRQYPIVDFEPVMGAE